MAFNEDIRLPEDVERGAQSAPTFNTTVITLANGFERRNQNWSLPRQSFDISYGISLKPQLDAVINTFYAVKGQFDGFRFKDWSDFEIGDSFGEDDTTRQQIGTTDTTTNTFQIYKRYAAGAVSFNRVITKPVAGTVRLWVNSVEITLGAGASQFQVNTTTGVVTIGSTLAAQSGTAVEVICEFDVPVRFNTDLLNISTEVFHEEAVINLPGIPLIELRV